MIVGNVFNVALSLEHVINFKPFNFQSVVSGGSNNSGWGPGVPAGSSSGWSPPPGSGGTASQRWSSSSGK